MTLSRDIARSRGDLDVLKLREGDEQAVVNETGNVILRTTTSQPELAEFVRRYNLHLPLVELLRTALREFSPESAPAFSKVHDLPRIYAYLLDQLKTMGVDTDTVANPAVMEIPPAPEHREHSITAKDTWAEAWEAGYRAAWDR